MENKMGRELNREIANEFRECLARGRYVPTKSFRAENRELIGRYLTEDIEGRSPLAEAWPAIRPPRR